MFKINKKENKKDIIINSLLKENAEYKEKNKILLEEKAFREESFIKCKELIKEVEDIKKFLIANNNLFLLAKEEYSCLFKELKQSIKLNKKGE